MAHEVAKAAKRVRTLPQEMVKAGVKAANKPLLESYKRDTGGDLLLSGLRRSGRRGRLRVTTSVRGSGTGGIVRGRAMVRPAGPASWLNSGTAPRPQGSGWHPGTRGKRTFDRAVPAALEAARREVKRIFHESMR